MTQTGAWVELQKTMTRHKAATAATGMMLVIVIVAIFAPQIAPRDPLDYDIADRFHPPGAKYLLGTDSMGRCVLSRVIWGARISLQVGLLAVGIGTVIGITVGLIAGYSGGWVESLIMRMVDIGLSFPMILLAILIVAFFGPGLVNVMIAVGLDRSSRMARIAHSATLQVKQREFIEASRAVGASSWTVIRRHILPNIAAPVIVRATLDIAIAILTESSLSFLGLGVVPPTPTWGAIINGGRQFLVRAPWISTAAGAAIFITVLSINLMGDGLRDFLDPRIST
ncbi:MAG: ABC transporter permease [Bacillota bacterium]